ncbi:MAG: MFS transporter [Deltaproteobacteria bacterium]|nr:MFS transporter [Deltaproteobacteria bacterium]
MSDKKNTASTTHPALGPFVAFHYRDFRLFWIGLFISNIGNWVQITAISWLLYELTNSPFQLGLNGVFRAVPTICLGLFGGTITDRCDRKRLLLATQITLMLLALVLGYLAQTGLIRVWHIYALTLVSAIVGALDGPARQAALFLVGSTARASQRHPRNIYSGAASRQAFGRWRGAQ